MIIRGKVTGSGYTHEDDSILLPPRSTVHGQSEVDLKRRFCNVAYYIFFWL